MGNFRRNYWVQKRVERRSADDRQRERSAAGAFGWQVNVTRAEVVASRTPLSWYTRVTEYERCFYCLRDTPADERTRDHILAISNGGKHAPENVIMACIDCNQTKARKGFAGMLEERVHPTRGEWLRVEVCRRLALKPSQLGMLKR